MAMYVHSGSVLYKLFFTFSTESIYLFLNMYMNKGGYTVFVGIKSKPTKIYIWPTVINFHHTKKDSFSELLDISTIFQKKE